MIKKTNILRTIEIETIFLLLNLYFRVFIAAWTLDKVIKSSVNLDIPSIVFLIFAAMAFIFHPVIKPILRLLFEKDANNKNK